MNFLFVHQNFPAQYQHLVRHLADQPGNRVYFITQPNDNFMEGVTKVVYPKPSSDHTVCHPFTLEIDTAIRTGLSVASACRTLRDQGFVPDIVIGHSGWGEMIFIKDVFPDTPALSYFEFFYHTDGVDVGFDQEFSSIFGDPARLRVRNTVNHLTFDAVEWGHTATRWQQSLYPPELRRRLTALHEGVDTDLVRPDPKAWIRLSRNGTVLGRDQEIVTYVARNFEPYRGFHVFMRAVPEILRRRKRAEIVIAGGDNVSYGNPPPPGMTYREMMLRELGSSVDLSRVHFLGQIPHRAYLNLLQVSSAHIYLTYPFVLSWSFIEAMACGCLVIGSDTPPVTEVLQDRVNGLRVDFFSPKAIADRVDEVLEDRDRMQHLRDAARRTAVERFDLKRRQLPRWEKLIADVIAGRRPELDLTR